MKRHLLFAAVALLLSCKSPEPCDPSVQACVNYGVWAGMPGGGSHPEPGDDDDGKNISVFYTQPGCVGDGYIAADGGLFVYHSVISGGVCRDESGVGYGP